MLLAFVRPVPPTIVDCELTHLLRQPIDFARAARQHEAYQRLLTTLGCDVRILDALPDHPDSVFVEDTAIVLDECAIVSRPGAESRRGETIDIAEALGPYRKCYRIDAPGTLDGGDVLRVGKRLYVGMSTRSNADGARQLSDILGRFGYTVKRVPMRDCLHLKTAASTLPDGSVLLDPRCVDARELDGGTIIPIDAGEPTGANVLVVNETVICPAAAPKTRQTLERRGYATVSIDASELAKAEGGLTCCALLVRVAGE